MGAKFLRCLYTSKALFLNFHISWQSLYDHTELALLFTSITKEDNQRLILGLSSFQTDTLLASPTAGIMTTSRCITNLKSPDGIRMTCNSATELIWIRRAFMAKSQEVEPEFCYASVYDASHCVACEQRLTMAMRERCNMISNCWYSAECSEEELSGNCEQESEGHLYVHVEYECLLREYQCYHYLSYFHIQYYPLGSFRDASLSRFGGVRLHESKEQSFC